MHAPKVIVAGVSGAGKSTVGVELARMLGLQFTDADDLHPAANVAKMSAGIPLTDDDRWPWLALVGEALAAAPDGIVIACSALRRSYRDAIRAVEPSTIVVMLDGSREVLERHLEGRTGHFMPPALLDSQLATLEPLQPDERGGVVEVGPPVETVVADALALVHKCTSA